MASKRKVLAGTLSMGDSVEIAGRRYSVSGFLSKCVLLTNGSNNTVVGFLDEVIFVR